MILEQLKINQNDYENLSGWDLVSFECPQCHIIKSKIKKLIQPSISSNQEYIYCSNSCASIHQNRHLGKIPTKEEFEKFIEEGMSTVDMARKLGRSQGSIKHWLDKYELKTKYKYRQGHDKPTWKKGLEALARYHKTTISPNKDNYKNYNWIEIQTFYDAGKTWNDIHEYFKVSLTNISKASKNGLFKTRKSNETNKLKGYTGYGKKHTAESKEKIRQARLNYLAKNPDKASWKTKDKFRSIPCERVKDELKLLNISFVEELMPLIHKQRFYAADIAFPEKMIICEINGSQHYTNEGLLKPYYQERHDLIEAEGWIVYEIPYHVAMRKGFVKDFIIPILNEIKPIYNLDLYQRTT